MSIITEGKYAAEHIIEEVGVAISRETVTLLDGVGAIEPGTVLGKITASGKYKPATATGSDGAQTAAAVAVYGADSTDGDVEVVVSARLTVVNKNLITYGSTIDNETKKDAANAQLASSMIIVR